MYLRSDLFVWACTPCALVHLAALQYVRPLYKDLIASRVGRAGACLAFKQNESHYHPIAAKMIRAVRGGSVSLG